MAKRFLRYWLPVIVYAGIIFYYSSLTEPLGEISLFSHADKFIHFFEFACLGLLLRRALLNDSSAYLQRHAIFWTLVIGVMYGVSDEFHQSFVPGRDATHWDLLFDGIGISASLWVKMK